MSNKPEEEKVDDPPDSQENKEELVQIDKFHEIEIQQVFESMVGVQNLRIQTGIFFGTVNLGAIGIAFSIQKAGIIILASLLLAAFMIIDYRGFAAATALYYRAIQLEEQFSPNESDTFLTILFVGLLDSTLKSIAQYPDREERVRALKQFPIRNPGVISFWLPLAAFLGEIVFGVVLWQFFNWPLF